MATDNATYRALQAAVAAGDMEAMRASLLNLDSKGVELLRAHLSDSEVDRLFALSRRSVRGTKRGRVIVIHGIMGSQLDCVQNNDADRVWLNLFRIARGRMADLRLTPDGAPADPKKRVVVRDMFPEYLPLLNELATEWHVSPFVYDWRTNIDDAAAALADRVRIWSKKEPTHILCHSMGGLVARRFSYLSKDLWSSIEDPDGMKKGGRLIMLGTPNKGSFAIPMVLSGAEKTVKMLAAADFVHSMDEIVDILATFLGVYQMLPSPAFDGGDDRRRLFEKAAWGRFPVSSSLLAQAKSLHASLEEVVDAARLLYVAGYDQETPFRIKVDGPGKFKYRTTRDGDGRVPHELGLLNGVNTLYVRENHGDLPRNRLVLAGIHDLLVTGHSDHLESALPRTRKLGESSNWQRGEDIDLPPAEAYSILAQPLKRGQKQPMLSAEKSEQLEASILSAYLGGPRDDFAVRQPEIGVQEKRLPQSDRLNVEVVWGDLTAVQGDVYTVGHYDGILPQNAELALDRVVSGRSKSSEGSTSTLLLTGLTERGLLSGKLGQVSFFPWIGKASRSIAIAGMGTPGTFGRSELRRLARNTALAVQSVPKASTVVTVLIGSGVGNLPASDAVQNLVLGYVDAMNAVGAKRKIRKLRIVERDFRKANDIAAALRVIANSSVAGALDISAALRKEKGGDLGRTQCLSLALISAIRAAQGGKTTKARKALEVVLDGLPHRSNLRKDTLEFLESMPVSGNADVVEQALRLELGTTPTSIGLDSTIPVRFSFSRDGNGFSATAITDTAVVPQRRLTFDFSLVEEIASAMVDPQPDVLSQRADLLTGLILPREFRLLLEGDSPLVFEVDRDMARVPWEMLTKGTITSEPGIPLALRRPVSRQLRTTYSPGPEKPQPRNGRFRALVVGDPGDPAQGHALPGAAREAQAVAAMLESKNVDVTVMIGAPSASRRGELAGVRPASRSEVLAELMKGGYDILHYAGHGGFDEDHSDLVGWVFEGGMLTPHELERIDSAPALIVANACLSAMTAGGKRNDRERAQRNPEADLLPSLADEFFKRGVRNYVGTAWEVSDIGSVRFATAFYDFLMPADREKNKPTPTIGDAMLYARTTLRGDQSKFGVLWAAYQHYGDPNYKLTSRDYGEVAGSPKTLKSAKRSQSRKKIGRATKGIQRDLSSKKRSSGSAKR